MHLPYPTDISLSPFIQVFQNSLNEQKLNFMEDCKRHLQQLVLAQKAKRFWEDGIMTFAER